MLRVLSVALIVALLVACGLGPGRWTLVEAAEEAAAGAASAAAAAASASATEKSSQAAAAAARAAATDAATAAATPSSSSSTPLTQAAAVTAEKQASSPSSAAAATRTAAAPESAAVNHAPTTPGVAVGATDANADAAALPPLVAQAPAPPPNATTAATAASNTTTTAQQQSTAESRARDLLARANAVLALRKAGLLPGGAAGGGLDPAMASKTVEAVNRDAPLFEAAGGVKFKPSLTQTVGDGSGKTAAPAPGPAAAAKKPISLRAKWAGADSWATAPAASVIENYASKWRPTLEGAKNSTLAAKNRTAGGGLPLNLGNIRIQASAASSASAGAPSAAESVDAAAASAAAAPSPATEMRVTTLANGTRIISPTAPGQVAANALIGEYGPLREGESIGAVIQFLFGFRIATPFFGTGFNFCVDRYWGSFPKVGVVIPNAAAWLLPDLANIFAENGGITANLELPTLGVGGGLPAGARAEPSSDGFVIWLPSVQPLYISNLGFRFGLQIAQLFGIDFGFGILKIGCRVDFVRV